MYPLQAANIRLNSEYRMHATSEFQGLDIEFRYLSLQDEEESMALPRLLIRTSGCHVTFTSIRRATQVRKHISP